MAAEFPGGLPTFTPKLSAETILAAHVNKLQEEVYELARKVGITNDTEPLSLDRLLKHSSSVDTGHTHTEATISGTISESKILRPGSPILARLAQNEVVAGNWAFPSVMFTAGYGLNPSNAGHLRIGAGGSAPEAVSLSFGDGSGRKLNLGPNITGTFTPRFSFYDTGDLWMNGKLGVGVATPLAKVHIAAGGTAANSAALKLSSGSLLSVIENGAFEYNGTSLFFSAGGVRVDLLASSGVASGISFTPTGTLGSTNVQAALAEVDGDVQLKLPLAGGTLTSFLTLHANPTSNLHAATKQYVDANASSAKLLGQADVRSNLVNSTTAATILSSTITVTTTKGNLVEITFSGVGRCQRTSALAAGIGATIEVIFELRRGGSLVDRQTVYGVINNTNASGGSTASLFGVIPSVTFYDSPGVISNVAYDIQAKMASVAQGESYAPVSSNGNGVATVIEWG